MIQLPVSREVFGKNGDFGALVILGSSHVVSSLQGFHTKNFVGRRWCLYKTFSEPAAFAARLGRERVFLFVF